MTLVNIALGKKAFQSSLSPYSEVGEASDAVSGVWPSRFAFHTEEQICPWWYVDLGQVAPIHSIVLHNRIDGFIERAFGCCVDISDDLLTWRTIHSGFAFFGSLVSGSPLMMNIESQVSGRYIKVSLPTMGVLHLSQVEVFSNDEHLRLYRLRNAYRLSNILFENDYHKSASLGSVYNVIGDIEDSSSPLVHTLRLVWAGRLGNQIRQLCNAIAFAKRENIPNVQLATSLYIFHSEAVEICGVTVLPADARPEGLTIQGDFYYEMYDLLPALADFHGKERCEIASALRENGFFDSLLERDENKLGDCLTIHIRSGDLFDRPDPNPGYVQPPLSFYTKVIKKLLDERKINRIQIVYEDTGNPCVLALEQFAHLSGIEVRMVSGTLQSDLAVLIDSERLMLGTGTFGAAVCLLSKFVREVYQFETIHDNGFADMPNVGRFVVVSDPKKEYIQTGDWHNTVEQRELMLTFGEDRLLIHESGSRRS